MSYNYHRGFHKDHGATVQAWIDKSFERIKKEIGKEGIDALGKDNVVQYLDFLAELQSTIGNWQNKRLIQDYSNGL